MALVKCAECGHEVSQKAGGCPKCGAPVKQKTSMVTWFVAIVFGFGFIVFLSSQGSSTGDTSPSSTGTTTNYKIGETAHVGYTSYAIWKAFFKKNHDGYPNASQAPDASYLYIAVTVRNDDKQPRTIPPFQLIDEHGAEYDVSSKAWSVDGSIGPLENLNPGVEKVGYLVFDVPKGKHYKLKISGGYWSSDKALVDLGL